MCEFVDDLNALSMPYIYKNDEHFWKVAETLGMDILRSDKMKEAGFYGLTGTMAAPAISTTPSTRSTPRQI